MQVYQESMRVPIHTTSAITLPCLSNKILRSIRLFSCSAYGTLAGSNGQEIRSSIVGAFWKEGRKNFLDRPGSGASRIRAGAMASSDGGKKIKLFFHRIG